MRWYFIGSSGAVKKATNLIYCKQNLSVFFRDVIGTPPYEKANDLIYCKQNLSVFNRTP